MFIMLIERVEGNTAYRDIGPAMERELLNHIGDVPCSRPWRSFNDCPTFLGCVEFFLADCFSLSFIDVPVMVRHTSSRDLP